MTASSEALIHARPTQMSSIDEKLDPRVLRVSLRDLEMNEIELGGDSAHEDSGWSEQDEIEPDKIELMLSQCNDFVLLFGGISPGCSFPYVTMV